MKKLYGLFVFIFLLIASIVIISISFRNNKFKEELIGTGSIVSNSNKGVLNLSGSVQKKKEKILSKEDLKKECQKIIDGKESEYLENINSLLLNKYKKAISIIKKNEYIIFNNLKQGLCGEFEKVEEKNFCEAYKQKDIKLAKVDKNSYDYILLDSFISGENKCKFLLKASDVDDCSTAVDFFLISFSGSLNNDINDILELHGEEKGKILFNIGEEEYKKKVNKLFLEKCYNL